jgi:hypothetical protein
MTLRLSTYVSCHEDMSGRFVTSFLYGLIWSDRWLKAVLRNS